MFHYVIYWGTVEIIITIIAIQGGFPSSWKEAAVVPVAKNGNNALVTDCWPISIVNYFCELSECAVHDELSFHFKFKLYRFQYWVLKLKSTVTYLVTYSNTATPFLYSQGQVDSLYLGLR
jgi:hypothetical protein